MLAFLLIAIGAVDLYYSWRFMKDSAFTKRYVSTNPKAAIWKKMFGEKKAIKLTRTVFAPIGLALGVVLVLAGIFSLLG